MKTITALVPQGHRSAQISPGKTLTLSSDAKIPLEITIKPFKLTRSKSQNKLAWMWASHLADSLGGDKAHYYATFKLNHLAPVMARDDPDFAGLFDQFKELVFGMEGTNIYDALSDSFISASKCNTKQMAEALTNWEMAEGSNGNPLPRPDDYAFALQLKSYEELQKTGK
ncbi:MAG: hypothetical protein CSB47_10400 [Proteobacteria bacterium]|nr:MAG: hypothetical protein CSB47_10400 [Pseudomonadota bacterium]